MLDTLRRLEMGDEWEKESGHSQLESRTNPNPRRPNFCLRPVVIRLHHAAPLCFSRTIFPLLCPLDTFGDTQECQNCTQWVRSNFMLQGQKYCKEGGPRTLAPAYTPCSRVTVTGA